MDPIMYEMKKVKDALNSYLIATKLSGNISNFNYEIREMIDTCEKIQFKELDNRIIYCFLDKLYSELDSLKRKYNLIKFNDYLNIDYKRDKNKIKLSFMGQVLFDYSSNDIIELSLKFIDSQASIIYDFTKITNNFFQFVDHIYKIVNEISIDKNIKISTIISKDYILRSIKISFKSDVFQCSVDLDESCITGNCIDKIDIIRKKILNELDKRLFNKRKKVEELNLIIENDLKNLQKILKQDYIDENHLAVIHENLKVINDKHSITKE